ncbi:YcxB family protein [Sphingomonas sp. DG1-23]|uniref:YcxB family protein n=1 Tax=Sphingomonas sp. DG1-23 TaxID=3068316 RepID=UPI00274028A9|nr:YcxB family protein [Sphingomonas sp. DG1-23]MDP5280442.1 YcxB family protein [Sphingomonas sp. DG1-23]
MPLEHHEPVTCVTFSLDEAAQISASRANFRRRIFSRRMLLRLAIGALAFAGAGLVFGIVIEDPDPVGTALLFGGEVLVLFPLMCVLLYALIPRRVRRVVRQNPLSSRPVEACWSLAGLSARSANGTSELPWSDFYGWHAAAIGFLLYFNEQHYHLIPAAILSEAQQAGLRATLEASAVRRL